MTINPLVVARTGGGTSAWSGIYLAEDIRLLDQGVVSGSWVDGTLGGVGAALDVLGLVTDPLGTLVSWGVAWLLDHVKPLSEALDALAGNPAQIAANAQTWRNVSDQLATASRGYADSTVTHLGTWNGAARAAYDGHATELVGALGALSGAAHTMSSIVQGSGELVALVRTLVRDAIAEFVSVLAVRLWEWLAEEAGTLGIGTPWVIAQVSALVAKWVDKIAHFFRGLINSLRRLGEVARKLAQLIDELIHRHVLSPGKDRLPVSAHHENVNSISNMGTRSSVVNTESLATAAPGQGFSGVYEPRTGQFTAYPSVDDPLAPGAPVNAVDRYGGHGDTNASTFGSSSTTVGFVAIPQEDGSILMKWNSASVNLRNFGSRAAPMEYRQGIMDAIAASTGRRVWSE
jgi:hypothetical protein